MRQSSLLLSSWCTLQLIVDSVDICYMYKNNFQKQLSVHHITCVCYTYLHNMWVLYAHMCQYDYDSISHSLFGEIFVSKYE